MSSYNHLSSRSRCCLLLILLTTSPITHAFAPPHTTNSPKAARSILSSYSSDQTNAADEQTPNNNTHNRPSSDLKALLPKPASRPLQLDKFGRRIYRMEDDTTVRHTKGSPSSVDNDGGGNSDIDDVVVNEKIIEGDRSTTSQDYTTTTTSSSSSNLSNLLSDSKQRAGDKSLTQTFNGVHSSSDLKALLPTAKMRFMKLDKFGRRVQRMEDDGTVSYSRSGVSANSDGNDEVSESGVKEEVNSIRGVKHSINSQFTSDSEVPPTPPSTTTNPNEEEEEGPSLSELIASPSPTSDLEKDAKTKTGIHGTDLKALLPTTKMRFMKLDKFGRRVQRMEDDGTVSYSRSGDGGLGETSEVVESESMVDLGSEEVGLASATASSTADSGSSSANLKDLAGTSKRPVFTKLDFKGGSVEDDRRMVSSSSSSSTDPEEEVPSSGLKELALSSKRPIFTKLDFKGGSVEDDRRTNNNMSSSTTAATTTNETSPTKSNLKELLPKRPTFTKLDFKGGNVEDERRTKTQSSQSLGAPIQSSGSLQTLLPERKFMWKKQERRSTTNDFIGNVGGDFIARTTTSGSGESGRERRQKAVREEVMASASLNAAEEEEGVALDDDNDGSSDGSSEGEGSYSNLTDLLPQKKFVFRETRK